MKLYCGVAFGLEDEFGGVTWLLDQRRPMWRRRVETVLNFPSSVIGTCRHVLEERRRGRRQTVAEVWPHLRRLWRELASPSSYSDLVGIEEGDWLTVFGEDGGVLFSGEIDPDEETGWEEYPFLPDDGEPKALGYVIKWTQRGWEPDDWARLFLHDPPHRAELKKP